MVKDFFMRCEDRFPEQRTQLRQVSLALRRERISTMEQLCRLFREDPEALAGIRSIGRKRLELIELVYRTYQADRRPAEEKERREGAL